MGGARPEARPAWSSLRIVQGVRGDHESGVGGLTLLGLRLEPGWLD